SLSGLFSFHLNFLSDEDTFIGSFLQNFFGIDAAFSAVRLMIMLSYIAAVYFLFMRQTNENKK
ncbi:MAG TPA: hypothetical protein VE090_05355, partial [Methylomirabilota bacterium]|nr:hypothetical protein [Methylomirabilota bacterium]